MDSILLSLVAHFSDLLDVSLRAGMVILLVLFARLLLKRAPKVFSYALWGVVLLRLLVPVSIESPVSVVPKQTDYSPVAEVNQVLPELRFETPRDHAENVWYAENTPPGEVLVQINHTMDAKTYLTCGWLFGIGAMVVHSVVSYWKLRKKVRVGIALQKGIFMADDIRTPFVMGIFRPVIFLPGILDETERSYIIAHEQHHIRRGDHIFKALGFLALTIHWFNPLVWVAFVLAGRDMEMSCDEAVIRKLGADIRADYSASLLNLATGHRLFSITPLAFGEGDPTGRVRNLAKWKKPGLWVSVICAVLCALLAVCLLTDRTTPEQTESLPGETVPAVLAETSPPQTRPPEMADIEMDCISIKVDDVSRTGAAALFVYGGTTAFSYDDFLCLEQWVDEKWIPVEEVAGYAYYVGDSSYPVRDGYGMVHEWSDRFGELPDGRYRLGKKVTRDGTGEERILYSEFSLPDSIRVDPLPLEALPERYPAEEAMQDGCFVKRDGVAADNKELFREFATRTQGGESGFIRILDWSSGEGSASFVCDLTFDGSRYTLAWLENGERVEHTFRYLKHYTGRKEISAAAYDTYEHYVLVNDDTLTWMEIWESMYTPPEKVNIDYMRIYSDYVTHPVVVQLPSELTQAVLEFEGESLVTVTDSARLEHIYDLFDGADVLGYEPKTHSTGVRLHLILTFRSGTTVTFDLDPDRDICKLDDEFVFYGAFDEPDYIEKLWRCLGISGWPDPVYERYPHAYQA